MFDWFRRKQAPPARKMTSADLADILRCGSLSAAGQAVTPERAMRVATVYACVRILAESIAQLPCKIYKRGADDSQELVDSGPLFDLLHFPNAWQNSFEFREYLMACLCLRGNFYALKTTRRGAVIELLPLRPDAVSARRRNWEMLYTYTDAEGRTGTVGADRMLHVRGLSLDGIMGVSPIRYGRDAIGLAMATEKHGSLIFKNGARPGGVLIHPGHLSDEALEHLKLSWEAAHSGENTGRTAILEEGMKYESMSMTSEDAQYLETRQFQRNEICALFRVPPHMIGDLTKSSFSNITQQSLEFVKYSVLPWCRRIETAFWHGLLTDEQRRAGFRVEFLVDGLERADIKTRYESYSIAIQNGILSPNECRRLENRNPREGGDVFLQPLNMTDGRGAETAETEAEKKENEIEKAAAYLSGQFGEDMKALAKSAAEEMKAAAAALKAASPGSLMAPDAGAAQAEGTRSGLPGEAAIACGCDSGRGVSRNAPTDATSPPAGVEDFRVVQDGMEIVCRASAPACHAERSEASPQERDAIPGEILRSAQNDSLEAKAAEDDDEPEHDDWADAEWNPEVAAQNDIMRRFRLKLFKHYKRIIQGECAEVRALVERFFPAAGQKAAVDPAFMSALEALYIKLERAFADNSAKVLYHEFAAAVATAAARKIGVTESVLDDALRESVGRYVDIIAQDRVASSLGQIRKIIREAGDAQYDVGEALRRRLNEWESRGARKTSMLQAVATANHYARNTYRKLGVQRIRWVAQGAKTCEFCAKLDGWETGINDPFVGRGVAVTGRDGGKFTSKRKVKYPPIHTGCVCAIVPVLDKNLYPDELAGVKRGDPMTPEEAILANPGKYTSPDWGFSRNCGAAVAAYEARRRGYDLTALSLTDNAMLQQVSEKLLNVWNRPVGGEFFESASSRSGNAEELLEFLKKNVEPGKRYIFSYANTLRNGRAEGHVVHIFRDADGIKWHDPQNGKVGSEKTNLFEKLERIKYTTPEGKVILQSLMRVDNLPFNEDILKAITQPGGQP